jgi:hypothetical protein
MASSKLIANSLNKLEYLFENLSVGPKLEGP